MPYRLRVHFADNTRQGAIDFDYNNKQIWTSVQEVGGLGASNGSYDDIKHLLR